MRDYLDNAHPHPDDPAAPLWPNRALGGARRRGCLAVAPLDFSEPVDPGAVALRACQVLSQLPLKLDRVSPKLSPWNTSISTFGAASAEKLAGPGDREAAIRTPLANLVSQLGQLCKRPAVLYDEVRDEDRRVRPDYGVSINKVMMGYIEVKAPGRSIDPTKMTGHDLEQWNRQKDLPNLIYTNGTQWRLYTDGELVEVAVLAEAPLADLDISRS